MTVRLRETLELLVTAVLLVIPSCSYMPAPAVLGGL